MKHRYFALFCLALIAGLTVFWMTRTPTLSFRPIAIPEGFRELVVRTSSSRPDGTLALMLGHNTRTGSREGPATGLTLCDALFRDATSPSIGEPDSGLIIIEFFDYRCPYCRVLSDFLFDIQASQTGVRVVYKEWPILSEASELAARAALAAAEQDRYEDFHRRMINARLVPTISYIEDTAAALGLDTEKLLQDMQSEDLTLALERNAWVASEIGFFGTPALVVGRTIVQGAIDRQQLEELVQQELLAGSMTAC